MKNARILAVLALAVPAASAQTPGRAEATATVTIYKAITLTKVLDMKFGAVAAGPTSGTIVLSPEGARTGTGGAAPLANSDTVSADAPTYAEFTASGPANQAYSISLPIQPVEMNQGADRMTLTDFRSSLGAAGRLSSSGTQTFKVGATLNVGANQPVGEYMGQFEVTVAYN